MQYKHYMFKINGEILKPKDFKQIFGIHYKSMFVGAMKEITKLPFGTHIKTYKDITFVVIIY